jgi:hypothetical protein
MSVGVMKDWKLKDEMRDLHEELCYLLWIDKTRAKDKTYNRNVGVMKD